MKKVNTIKGKMDNQPKKDHNPQSSTPSGEVKKEDKKDEEHTLMVIDDLDKQVDINDLLKEKEKENHGVAINLDEDNKPKKPKKEYDLDDTIIRDITLSNETHLRLLSNINGYFIDIRKFFRGYPSSKGIRVSAGKFAIAMDYLKKDIEQLNLPGLNKP